MSKKTWKYGLAIGTFCAATLGSACSDVGSMTASSDTDEFGIDPSIGQESDDGVRRNVVEASSTGASTDESDDRSDASASEETGSEETASSDMVDQEPVRFDVGVIGDPVVIDPKPVECDGLIATVRDMQDAHDDFEVYTGNRAYEGLVLSALGDDGTPVFNPDYDGPAMITSEESFYDWYHDMEGVNESFSVELQLTEDKDGIFIFDESAFFPLDDMGFGNEDRSHNYHFTTEVHTSFTYSGGEVFTFRGDDDLWMFVDGQLAIDLGGLHAALEATVEMDDLGLTVGETYSMDIFHAERHTSLSNFRIETTIDCFVAPLPEG